MWRLEPKHLVPIEIMALSRDDGVNWIRDLGIQWQFQ